VVLGNYSVIVPLRVNKLYDRSVPETGLSKKEFFMKKKHLFAAALACLLAFSLLIVSCGEGGDSDLVAAWYLTQTLADAGDTAGLVYEFRSNGKLLMAGVDGGVTWTTSGGVITTSGPGGTGGTANYTVSGTVLTISNAEPSSLLISATLYRKAP
jgi:hypothetical protein